VEIPFQEAAALLAPLLSRGAGAAAATVGEQAGARTLSEAGQVARGLRDRLGRGEGDPGDGADTPSVADVEVALREAVADGDVSGEELARIVAEGDVAVQAGGDVSIKAGNSVFVGSKIKTRNFRA